MFTVLRDDETTNDQNNADHLFGAISQLPFLF